MEAVSEHKAFGGTVGFYKHHSAVNNCEMKFSAFVPRQVKEGPRPVITYLAGLTCTEETFMIKSGAQRVAAELGYILIAPDTSPRGDEVPDDPEGAWDFGKGAGFYVNATQEPWSQHYQMYDYVTKELQTIIKDNFNANMEKQGIMGHSMGGHGALVMGLRNHQLYHSVSAFAPICAPSQCPWGEKAFSNYLGNDRSAWQQYDAAHLMANVSNARSRLPIMIDQGTADQFLEAELMTPKLQEAAAQSGYPVIFDMHEGYDHGYYFISSVMEKHLRFHAYLLEGEMA